MLKNDLSSSYDDCDSAGISTPALANVSVMTTDCPPVIATRPIRTPATCRPRANISTASSIASRLATPTAPLCRSTACHTPAGVASQPGCEKCPPPPPPPLPPPHPTPHLPPPPP